MDDIDWDSGELIPVWGDGRGRHPDKLGDYGGLSIEDPRTYRQTTGERLKALRQQRGLSLTEFARLLRMSKSQVARIEDGNADIRGAQLRLIEDIFNVPPTEILRPRGPEAAVWASTRGHMHGHEFVTVTPPLVDQTGHSFSLKFSDGPMRFNPHQGRETLLVVLGRIRVEVGRYDYHLESGHCLAIDVSQDHGIWADGFALFLLFLSQAAQNSHLAS